MPMVLADHFKSKNVNESQTAWVDGKNVLTKAVYIVENDLSRSS